MFIFVSLLAVMSQRLRYIQNIDRNTQSWRGSGGWQFHWSSNPVTHASPHRILRFRRRQTPAIFSQLALCVI